MSDELNTRIERLRRKLAAATDPDDRDAFQAQLDKLENERPKPWHSVTMSGNAQAGIVVAGDVKGNIYLNGMRGKLAEELLHSYLERLAKRCGTLPLQGVREQRGASDVLAISQEQVYTQLATITLVEREIVSGIKTRFFRSESFLSQHVGEQYLPLQQRYEFESKGLASKGIAFPLHIGEHRRQLADFPAEELSQFIRQATHVTFFGPQLITEAIATTSSLVILGEPGSGKSTALRYLALTLAKAGLDDTIDLAERLEGWGELGEQGRLLPIFLPLLPLAKRLANEPGKAGSDEDVWNEIARHVEMNGAYPGLAAPIRDELDAGRVLLMLDGLDEVAGSDSRRRVVRAVRDFAAQHANCRIVVACRVRAYEGEQNVEWQLPGWPTATLANWTVGQMHYFIDAWYAEAAKASAMPDTKRDDRIAKLKQAISNRDDLKKLGVRPLLLTIMALVHLNDGRLPEDRVSLYSRCIDILLGQWEVAGKDETVYGSLMDYIKLPDINIKALRPLLAKAAFVAHEAGTVDNLGRIGRATLHEMVQDELEALKHPNPHGGAKLFLEYTDARAGLLQASDTGDAYSFPHQTFQEYLAGLELMSGVGFVDRIMQRRADDRWRIPILLGIGHAVSEGLLDPPYRLLNRLLKANGRDERQRYADLLLTVEIATDVSWDRLERGGAEFVALHSELAHALAGVVESTALPAKDCVYAGVLLFELGDLRPGVCDLNMQMVAFPTVTFLIGETADRAQYDDEKNDTSITLAPFALARFPVTNAQYALFTANEGYNPERSWWDSVGKQWLLGDGRKELGKWSVERLGKVWPNHPVIGVTWYEATAFCRWLTQQKQDSYIYRLPSEAEWEYAARGIERRPYPWGPEEPDAERANYNRKYNDITAVGCFTSGATYENIRDLAGNVWEWTASVYGNYAEGLATIWQVPTNAASKRFTLRGGGWYDQPLTLRASYRSYFAPDRHYNNVGFRLARHLPENVKD